MKQALLWLLVIIVALVQASLIDFDIVLVILVVWIWQQKRSFAGIIWFLLVMGLSVDLVLGNRLAITSIKYLGLWLVIMILKKFLTISWKQDIKLK